ncbi:50S ribosomal protein L29 [Candidatus Saccharibacteria bacterium]|nr:50S ribosomal protein L29 [Candidatus Saccharibacteria bacterium]
METKDLIKQVSDVKVEIAELRRRMHMGETTNVRAIRVKRKQLARMLTVMSEQLAKEKI